MKEIFSCVCDKFARVYCKSCGDIHWIDFIKSHDSLYLNFESKKTYSKFDKMRQIAYLLGKSSSINDRVNEYVFLEKKQVAELLDLIVCKFNIDIDNLHGEKSFNTMKRIEWESTSKDKEYCFYDIDVYEDKECKIIFSCTEINSEESLDYISICTNQKATNIFEYIKNTTIKDREREVEVENIKSFVWALSRAKNEFNDAWRNNWKQTVERGV